MLVAKEPTASGCQILLDEEENMKKIIALVMAVAMLLVCLAGCGGGDSGGTDYKVIRFAVAYDAPTLDPQGSEDDASYFIVNQIGEGLVLGYGGEIHPGVAERWESSEDGMTWTFYLRESKWSDGTDVTAKDFVYAAQRALDPNAARVAAQEYYVLENGEAYQQGECTFEEVGIKAVDDHTLELQLAHPNAAPLYTISNYSWFPMHQQACEAAGSSYGAEASTLISNGPFVCTEWAHESKFILKKNEHYWNAANVQIDEVQYIIGALDQVAADLAQAGELDVVKTFNLQTIATLEGIGFVSDKTIDSTAFLHMNCAGQSETGRFMSNVNFRKALSYAIDRSAVLNVAAEVGVIGTRITPPGTLTADGEDWYEAYPLADAWSVTAEPEKAKAYLQKALDELGVTTEELPEFELLCFDSQKNLDRGQAIQDMVLQTLGVKIVMNPQPIQQMLDMAYNGEFDFWFGGKTVIYPDWLKEIGYEYNSKDASAVTNYDNPAYTALYEEAEQCVDMHERNRCINEMETIILEDMATLYLYWQETNWCHAANLNGIEQLNGYGPYFATAYYTE